MLAASGLLLPASLGNTAAREGASGGALGGRHGANQRGRKSRRQHGDRKDRNAKKARGNPPASQYEETSAVSLAYVNFNEVTTIPVQLWTFDDNTGRWRKGDAFPLSSAGGTQVNLPGHFWAAQLGSSSFTIVGMPGGRLAVTMCEGGQLYESGWSGGKVVVDALRLILGTRAEMTTTTSTVLLMTKEEAVNAYTLALFAKPLSNG